MDAGTSDVARVLITGLGIVLPHGVGLRAADAVFHGESAVRRMPGIAGLQDATGAPLLPFSAPAGTERLDRAHQFAVAAAEEAWKDAGLDGYPPDSSRVATVISLSKGAIAGLAARRSLPRTEQVPWLDFAPDAAARHVAARLGLRGPVASPIAACASGAHALAWGVKLIEHGVADVALVGAAEASLDPLVIGSYKRMGVLADGGDDPASSVRPFSATRRGFAIGEGAGVLVLESAATAARRGVRAYAEVAGLAIGTHGGGLTGMESSGRSLARLASLAMGRASVEPADVDYVNAHGTATAENDLAEARAIRLALGVAANRVSVSSTKGAHGHLLGAAAAVELVLTVLAMDRNEVPPTANLTDPDPQIPLDCTPLEPRRRAVRTVLKLASGFGGQAAAICLVRGGRYC